MKLTKIKLPFGLNENNALIHISEVERGLKCRCICPSCRSQLIAAKGSIKQPHFKHAVENECENALESTIHLGAKKLIFEKKQITLPKHTFVVSKKDSKGREHKAEKNIVKDGKVITFDSIQEETDLHDMRADIIAKKSNTPLIIEIFYRHKVDDQKLEKIRKANISAIEIDLSNLTLEDIKDWESFWSYINDPSHIEWLHNAKARVCSPDLAREVVVKIKNQERNYKQEEIEKQRKEKSEQEDLSYALDNLKDLSSKESIGELKKNAKMHGVWKKYRQRLPFSLEDLPNFLNKEVSNGDWIFGCDRRIWQVAFYCSFICMNGKSFSIKRVDKWLQYSLGLNVHQNIKIVGIYSKKYPELIPNDTYDNLPSSWQTLREYFNYLCDIEMLEFSGYDYPNPGSCWFQVISKKPIRF
jgi:competence CoiA-like predicted nuclease